VNVRFQITEKQLRTRMLKELHAFRYHSDRDIVGELLRNLENKLRHKERMILDKLLTQNEIGIGLGMGPGGGPYTYVPLDKITPKFVRGIIRQNEGRSFYDLEPQCGTDAGRLFLTAWKKAIEEGLQRRLFFRHLHRYYTDETLYLQARAESEAKRLQSGGA
jgi:hypothetical protein